MFATVMLKPVARKEMLQVPSEAVIATGTRNVVVVALGDGRFAPVDVEIGMESNGQTEIRKGLEAGQKVVVSGQFLIDSEASLKGVTERMGAAPAAAPAPPAAPAAPMVHDHSKMEKAAP
jgi:membrane fusion protein, copper/silver efflux system